MNLLYPQINNKPTGLLNTQPISLLSNYSNFFTPSPQAVSLLAPTIQSPIPDYQYGDVDNDPQDVDVAPASTATTAQSEQALDALEVMTPMQALPFFGLPMQFSKFAHQQNIANNKSLGGDGHGNNNMGDPTAPGGIGGSAGNAASTGSGGFGPDMGGDGGFGL